MVRRIAVLLWLVLVSACGGGGGGSGPATPATEPQPTNADIAVLMLGNSHTHANGLPGMLAALLRAGRPGKTVVVSAAPGILFLDQRIHDAESLALFNGRNWHAVIFQAQQYSLSG